MVPSFPSCTPVTPKRRSEEAEEACIDKKAFATWSDDGVG